MAFSHSKKLRHRNVKGMAFSHSKKLRHRKCEGHGVEPCRKNAARNVKGHDFQSCRKKRAARRFLAAAGRSWCSGLILLAEGWEALRELIRRSGEASFVVNDAAMLLIAIVLIHDHDLRSGEYRAK
jgi:hypothetical protein